MQTSLQVVALVGLFVNSVVGTFVVSNPPGQNDISNEGTQPCGSNIITESSTFTNWPSAGLDISITNITDPPSTFWLNVALLSNSSNFETILGPSQEAVQSDHLCFPRIHGKTDSDWLDQPAILQIVENVRDGIYNYNCAGIRFVEGDPAPNVCAGGG